MHTHVRALVTSLPQLARAVPPPPPHPHPHLHHPTPCPPTHPHTRTPTRLPAANGTQACSAAHPVAACAPAKAAGGTVFSAEPAWHSAATLACERPPSVLRFTNRLSRPENMEPTGTGGQSVNSVMDGARYSGHHGAWITAVTHGVVSRRHGGRVGVYNDGVCLGDAAALLQPAAALAARTTALGGLGWVGSSGSGRTLGHVTAGALALHATCWAWDLHASTAAAKHTHTTWAGEGGPCKNGVRPGQRTQSAPAQHPIHMLQWLLLQPSNEQALAHDHGGAHCTPVHGTRPGADTVATMIAARTFARGAGDAPAPAPAPAPVAAASARRRADASTVALRPSIVQTSVQTASLGVRRARISP